MDQMYIIKCQWGYIQQPLATITLTHAVTRLNLWLISQVFATVWSSTTHFTILQATTQTTKWTAFCNIRSLPRNSIKLSFFHLFAHFHNIFCILEHISNYY